MAANSTVSFGGVVVGGPISTTPKVLSGYVSELSEGMVRYVQRSKASSITQWTLNFQNWTKAQKEAFETFYLDTAQGPTNRFDYIHTDGNTYEDVRFIDAELNWERVNEEVWNISVTIEL